jgi:hypothetical protein
VIFEIIPDTSAFSFAFQGIEGEQYIISFVSLLKKSPKLLGA